jgi:hypothetical protein
MNSFKSSVRLELLHLNYKIKHFHPSLCNWNALLQNCEVICLNLRNTLVVDLLISIYDDKITNSPFLNSSMGASSSK